MRCPIFLPSTARLLAWALLLATVGLLAPIRSVAGIEAGLELATTDGIEAAMTRSTDVEIEVHGLIARARVTQSFVNATDDWVEGRYLFPLPDGATVDELTVRIGQRVIEGVVREKKTAREAFQLARESGRSAGLVERQRANLFSTRLTNIGPGETVEVEIGFGQTVAYRHGEFRLVFPTATLPRNDNRPPVRADEAIDATMGAAVNRAGTDESLPPMPVARAARSRLRLRVELHAGIEIASIESHNHDVRIGGRGSERRVELIPDAESHGRDFELAWRPLDSDDVRGALFFEQMRGRAHALLMLVPPADFRPLDLRRELIVVLDRSGSMQGEAFEQARAAVRVALERIGPDDRFNVIAFNGSAQALFDRPRPAGARNLDQARRFIDSLHAHGGTEIDAALSRALGGPPDPGYLRQVVFATDGAVANEAQVLDRIDRELADARLFAVGIGHGVNAGFLERLADRGRGTLTRINDPADVAVRMGELLVQLESPVLEDVQVDWPLAAEVWPERLPDLYAGEPILVRARFDVPVSEIGDGTVRVTGLRDLRFVELEWPMSRLSFATGVARAWAQARIQALERRGPEEMDAQLQHDERLLTALDYGIVSSLTSLAAVDRTPRRSQDAALKRTEVAGTAPADRAHAFQGLPATDAGSIEAGLRGLAILTIVLLLVFNRRFRERPATERPDDDGGVRS